MELKVGQYVFLSLQHSFIITMVTKFDNIADQPIVWLKDLISMDELKKTIAISFNDDSGNSEGYIYMKKVDRYCSSVRNGLIYLFEHASNYRLR